MPQSTITINVAMDETRVPDTIAWSATDSTADAMQQAKGMILSFWDGADKAALRIDLWTKDMMMDEMADFFFQTMMTMADSFARATKYTDQGDDIKAFAKNFYQKFRERQAKENNAS